MERSDYSLVFAHIFKEQVSIESFIVSNTTLIQRAEKCRDKVNLRQSPKKQDSGISQSSFKIINANMKVPWLPRPGSLAIANRWHLFLVHILLKKIKKKKDWNQKKTESSGSVLFKIILLVF